MKGTMRPLLGLILVLTSLEARLTILDEDSPTRVENEFMVIFKESAHSVLRSKHMETVNSMIESTPGAKLLYEYDFGESQPFRGYAVRAPKESAAIQFALLSDDHVARVEQNKVVSIPELIDLQIEQPFLDAEGQLVGALKSATERLTREKEKVQLGDSCSQEREATWGLVRTSAQGNDHSGVYRYSDQADGKNAYAYVIDTGIYTEHSEFGGRALWGIDVMDDKHSCKCDSHGHGTHVAGTIMSTNYGIAKGAYAVAIRVLDEDGYGTDAGVIEGIEFALSDGWNRNFVVNMSLGGAYSKSLNDAVTSAVADGVPFVAAAGNEGQDACNTSPSSTANAITVTASDFNDEFCDFSNYGKCTNIIAPGASITSAWIGSAYTIATASGTSMAAPHVAGVVCKLMSQYGYMTPYDIKQKLLELGTDSQINQVTNGNTPNVLLYMGCD